MRVLFFIMLPVLVFSETLKLDQNVIQKLGIKLHTVKIERVKDSLTLPSKVSEYSGLVAEVFPPVSGVVKKVFVKEGDKVKKGAPLALVYSPHIADLQAQIRMAKVKLQTAQETLKREEMLYREEVIPYARYYGAKIDYERAKGEYEALLASLRSFGEVINDTVLIRSPISGYVIEQKIFTGSGVDISKEMFKIHSHEKLWVYAYATPEDATRVKVGMVGYVLWQGQRLEGKVDYVSHEVDPNTKRVPVRLLVNNVRDLLRPGLMVQTAIELGSVSGVWLPLQAVQKVNGRDVVFVKIPEGFSVKTVRKIRQEGEWVLVEGLKEGQQVATSGLVFLKSQVER
ncbi:MAG: efflux RND transporter periplasmic adaptor subunit [Hydrogenobacter thermophilus]|uniref:efflux RND transporter periplasmic adaptor subunit n=1 Tax=Hydrogenobacter thermophilus TaxID=940 RepID=UPI0030FB6F8A|nr:efflux RND transporter periplasmic adaptor subunit [Hydrogenobacter thermophilus]